MRSLVLALCLCSFAAQAQVSKVTPVSPVEPVAKAAAPCSDDSPEKMKAGDMTSALKAMAAATSKASDWEQASDDVLDLVNSFRKLSSDDRAALATLEEGKTPQQIFAGRLALLKALAKR